MADGRECAGVATRETLVGTGVGVLVALAFLCLVGLGVGRVAALAVVRRA